MIVPWRKLNTIEDTTIATRNGNAWKCFPDGFGEKGKFSPENGCNRARKTFRPSVCIVHLDETSPDDEMIILRRLRQNFARIYRSLSLFVGGILECLPPPRSSSRLHVSLVFMYTRKK